jgi:hypothetical protein
MRALVRCLVLSMCLAVAIPLCFANCGEGTEASRSLALGRSLKSIQKLAKELQGKKGDEVATDIVKQFGPAARDVGSGISIQQWDAESGVLTYSGGLASFRTKGGKSVWLTATVNKALPALTASTFEMTTMAAPQMKYWLGNLRLKPDSTYEFVDSGQSLDHRTGQTLNFFIKHPHGRLETHFAPGCTSDTILENLTDGTFLCGLTFLSANSG